MYCNELFKGVKMNKNLKKLSIKATIENLKVELKNVNSAKKLMIKRLIVEWEKALENLQLLLPLTLVPIYVNA